jgi:iron complex transport system permease protein
VALTVYALARSRQGESYTIILAGLALKFMFSALLGGLQYVAQEAGLRDLMFWLMGSLWNATYSGVLFISILLLPALALLLSQAWNLNSLAAGEEVAWALGVNLKRLHLLVVALACLLTAAVVSFMGAVGFVGLVGPHLGRALCGSDHRFLLPGAALCGALLLLGADTLARLLLWPLDLPAGIMTALLGGPFFIYLLIKGRKNSWL